MSPTRLSQALSRRFCFIGGQGKSGTTWVQLILDSHPDICCTGEGHPADVLATAMGQATAHHRDFIAGNNKLFGELEPYQALSDDDERTLAQAAVALLLARQCNGDFPAVLADRTPANIENIALLDALFPQACFVHMLRDPRDVAISLWYHGLRTNERWIRQRYGSLDRLALEVVPAWVQGVQTVRTSAVPCQSRYREVRYEDLHTNFDATVAALFAWLEVDDAAGHVDAAASASNFRAITGGRTAGTEDRRSHFRKGVMGDWRDQLTEATQQQLARQTGTALSDLGYT